MCTLTPITGPVLNNYSLLDSISHKMSQVLKIDFQKVVLEKLGDKLKKLRKIENYPLTMWRKRSLK